MIKLNKPEQFQAVFKLGKKLGTPFFAIWFKPNQLPYARLGLVVGKKAVKTAVKRNRIKRIVRESFRINQESLAGKDIVFTAYSHVLSLSRRSLSTQLEQHWSKIL